MNKSLLARTKREFYDKYAEAARSGGLSEEETERSIAEAMREAACLLEGKCPKCGAAIARYVDHEHQQGPSAIPGAWVMYRCSTQSPPGRRNPAGACDFMSDLVEGEAAN